jgi:hypothetical protein
MEQCISWEAKGHSVGKEIPLLLESKSAPPDIILCQNNPVHIFKKAFFNINFNTL